MQSGDQLLFETDSLLIYKAGKKLGQQKKPTRDKPIE